MRIVLKNTDNINHFTVFFFNSSCYLNLVFSLFFVFFPKKKKEPNLFATFFLFSLFFFSFFFNKKEKKKKQFSENYNQGPCLIPDFENYFIF